MKKALLPLAIAAAMPAAVLAEGPIDGTVYGKVNVSVINEETEVTGSASEDAWKLTSNASRIGFKGKTDLSDSLAAIYKLEYETFVDDGKKGDRETFTQRNIYAGLTGSFGTVFAGRHDTVLKLAQGKVDLFNDLEGGDIKNWMSGETRASNIINYTTPSFGGFSGSLMTILGEDSDEDQDQNGLFDSYSVGVAYENGGLYVALAHDENVDSGSVADDFVNINRLVASFSVGGLTLGAIAQQAEDGDNFEDNITDGTDIGYDETSYAVSAAYKIGAVTLKAQIGQGEYEVEDNLGGSKVEVDGDAWSVGADYKLGKATKVFAYYSSLEFDEEDLDLTEEETYYGVGLEHKF